MTHEFILPKRFVPEEFKRELQVEDVTEEARDQMLLQRLATNDQAAFWLLWQGHEDYLYHCCLKWMGLKEDAEDVLSEVMLKASIKVPELAGQITNLKGWLTRLSYNLCMNMQVKRQRYTNYVQPFAELNVASQKLVANNPSPEEVLLSDEIYQYTCQAIAALPPRLRQPAILRFLREMPYQEIAAQLAITPATARKRIQQARPLLQKALSGYLSGATNAQLCKVSAKAAQGVVEALGQTQVEIKAQAVTTFVVVPVTLPTGVVRTFHLLLPNKPTRHQQRLKTLQTYVKRYPNGWKKRLELANFLYAIGRWEEAISCYREVLVRAPYILQAYLQLGHLLELLKRSQEAIAVYSQALSQAHQEATQHHLRGLMACSGQQYGVAAVEFKAAASLAPDNALHWHELGQIQIKAGQPQEALRAFDMALQLNPDDLYALSYSYEPLMALRRFAEAQFRLSRVLELAPADVRSLTRLANLRLREGLYTRQVGKQSKKLLLTAQRIAPHAPEVSASLAAYYLCQEKSKKGIALLEAFVCEHPQNPGGWYHYACRLFDTGQLQAAGEAIERAYRLDQSDSQIYQAACQILPSAVPMLKKLKS